MLEEDEFQSADIFILPPEDPTRSDEDSGPDDDDGHIDNLSGNQLRAEAEATITVSCFYKKRIGADTLNDDEDIDPVVQSDDNDKPLESEQSLGSRHCNISSVTDVRSSYAKPPGHAANANSSITASTSNIEQDIDTVLHNVSNSSDLPLATESVHKLGRRSSRTAKRGRRSESATADKSNDVDDIESARARSRRTSLVTDTGNSKVKRVRRSASSNCSSTAPVELPPSRKKSAPPPRQWLKCDLKQQSIQWNAAATPLVDRSPSSLFELFFDDAVIDNIVEMSNLYAIQKSKQLDVTPSEIRLVIAILLISGYVPLVNRRMFWESCEDVHNAAVSSALTVNRFEEILRYLHVCDNTHLDASDKLSKLRPLFVMLNERFVQNWSIEQDISVDESMVPYYGRHSSKQFIRGKPIRFGFKVWCLNSRLGYLIQCDPYQGSSGSFNADLGLGGTVVSQLASTLPVGLPYRLFIDNFFTSPRLLDHLKTKNLSVTGTVRANRMENCPLKEADSLKKEARGTFDHRLDKNSGMIAVRWNDNNVVTMLSNCFGVEPVTQAKRWSAACKKHIQIPMPNLVAQYNRFMGGTDRMDQNVAKFRINIRIKKWWWALFCFTIDVSLQNAWLLYRTSEAAQHRPLTLVQFRRDVALTYIMKYRVSDSVCPLRSRAVTCRTVPDDVRFDGQSHFIGRIDGGQKRCAQCGMKVQKKCNKCGVALHDRCFEIFHQSK